MARSKKASGKETDISWNLEKFLVNRKAEVSRFGPKTTPAELTGEIESALVDGFARLGQQADAVVANAFET